MPKILSDQILLSDDVVVNVNIIPSSEETEEDILTTVKPLLTSQYVRAVKNVLIRYESSPLPTRFISGQKIYVLNLPFGLFGRFILHGDDIIIDANALSGIYNLPSSFLFSHEVGHKIAKYKAADATYKKMAEILDVSFDDHFYMLNETFADECGNMVSPEIIEHGVLPVPLSNDKRQAIRRLILSEIYRI